MIDRRASSIAAAVAAASEHPRPAALLCVNLHNFKALNTVLGHDRGDRLLARTEAELRTVGAIWRIAGDEFLALVGGPLSAVADRARALSWLLHTSVGFTLAWRIDFADGRPAPPPIPWRVAEVTCAPRVGLAELGGDAAACVALARQRCYEVSVSGPSHGFAPLSRGFTDVGPRADRACPACGSAPTLLDQDLGWTSESCTACGAAYERTDVQYVLGEATDAGW